MKKINLISGILIGILILTSCSSDDENGSEGSANLIVGTWQPTKEVDVCSTGSESVFDYDNCGLMGRYIFTAHNNPDLETDGTIEFTDFRAGSDGECDTSANGNGTWSLDGDNFTITINGETNNPTFFELTNNRLRIGYFDDDPNDPCDGENLPSHYYTEFTKL